MSRAPRSIPTDTANSGDVPAAVTALQPKKSMSEIADLLAANTMKMRGIDNPATPKEVIEDEPEKRQPRARADQSASNDADAESEAEALDVDNVDSNEQSEDADADEAGTALADGDDTGEDDDEDEAGRDEEEGEGEGDVEELELEFDDSDLVELDDDTTVSLGDLKKIYLAEPEIKKKIEEQNAATDEAFRMRAKAEQDVQHAKGAINAMLQHVLEIVAQPMVQLPDETLKTANPAEYIQRLDRYQNDQKRISETHKLLTQATEQFSQFAKDQQQERQKLAIQRLNQELPAMQSEDTRKQAAQDILDAAKQYGFTPEEVNLAGDHRLYVMAYAAAQYNKLMNKSSKEENNLEQDATEEKAKKKVRRTRTLRSRGTSAKARLSTQAKQVKVLKTKAKASGKTEDVAAYMVAKRST